MVSQCIFWQPLKNSLTLREIPERVLATFENHHFSESCQYPDPLADVLNTVHCGVVTGGNSIG